MTPTLIMTRPSGQGTAFVAAVRQAWAQPLHIIDSPLLEIQHTAIDVGQVDGVIFTSVNGVVGASGLTGLQAWCVGAKTAAAARAAGFKAIAGPGDADGLIEQIIAAKPSGVLAHIRGQHSRGDVAARLNAAGITCKDVIAYAQHALSLSADARAAIAGTDPVVFPLFSPRTATILGGNGPFHAPVHLVALSAAVKQACDLAIWASVHVAQTPDVDAMCRATCDALAVAIADGPSA